MKAFLEGKKKFPAKERCKTVFFLRFSAITALKAKNNCKFDALSPQTRRMNTQLQKRRLTANFGAFV